jgi:hypothetical protein
MLRSREVLLVAFFDAERAFFGAAAEPSFSASARAWSAAFTRENDRRKVCPYDASKSMKIHVFCVILAFGFGAGWVVDAAILGRRRFAGFLPAVGLK